MTDVDIKDMLEMSENRSEIPAYKPTPMDDVPYDPEDEDNEVYDPEKEMFDEEKPPRSSQNVAKKAKRSTHHSKDEPAFSSDESPSPPPPKGGFKSTFTKVSKSTEVQKKDKIEKSEPTAGFRGLPSSITSILFGSGSAAASSKSGNGNNKSEAVSGQRDPRKGPASAPNPEKTGSGSKKTSTLGSVSEADLLAAAAAQMDEIPPLPPMIGKPSSAPSSVKSKQAQTPAPPVIREKPAVYDKPPPKYDKPPPIHEKPPPPAAAARDSGSAPVRRDRDQDS